MKGLHKNSLREVYNPNQWIEEDNKELREKVFCEFKEKLKSILAETISIGLPEGDWEDAVKDVSDNQSEKYAKELFLLANRGDR